MKRPEKDSTWTHKATGCAYTVLGIGTGRQSTRVSGGFCIGPDCLEDLEVVVYQDCDRLGFEHLLVCPLEEFMDGRFVRTSGAGEVLNDAP